MPFLIHNTFFLLNCSCCQNTTSSTGLELKDYTAIGSLVLIIATFTADRIIAYKIRKKETLRTWYYKSLIEPHLEIIEKFYSDVLLQFEEAIKEIKINHSDIQIAKSSHIAKFQDLKRNFEFEFVDLVQNNIEKLNKSLTDKLLELEDNVTKIFDLQTLPINVSNVFTAYLSSHKAELYKTLFAVLKEPN